MLTDAQRRALDELVLDGTLTAAQKDAVAARLAAAAEPVAPKDHAARFTSIVALLGALLVFGGLALLVALRWSDIPRLARAALPIFVLLAVHHAVFVCAEAPGRFPRVGAALRLLGVLAFGPALVLIANVYRLESDFQIWILAWGLATVPFALRERSRWLVRIAVVLLVVWTLVATGSWLVRHRPPGVDGDSVLVLLLLGTSVVLKGLRALAAGTRAEWIESALRPLTPPLTIGGLLALSHRGAYADVAAGAVAWETFVIPGAAVLAGVLLCAPAGSVLAAPAARVIALEGFAVAATALLAALAIRFAPSLVVPLGNVALLCAIIALIAIGVWRGLSSYVNLGILGALVCGTVRYAEYLAEELSGAIAFIVAGVALLLFGTLLERRRRRWVERARRAST